MTSNRVFLIIFALVAVMAYYGHGRREKTHHEAEARATATQRERMAASMAKAMKAQEALTQELKLKREAAALKTKQNYEEILRRRAENKLYAEKAEIERVNRELYGDSRAPAQAEPTAADPIAEPTNTPPTTAALPPSPESPVRAQ